MTARLMASAALATVLAMTASNAFAAKSPQDFIKDAIQGDNSEIMLGEFVQQKASNAQVRQFGQTLVTDHSKAKDEASAVAKTLGVTPPTDASAEAKEEQAKLSKLSGADFDKEFTNFMVTDHQKDIQEFSDQTKAAAGPTSDLASKQLPALQQHLGMATTLAASNPTTGMTHKGSPRESMGWRASKLAGVAIYGPDNKKVGSITDILMSKEGKAKSVVIGVGGFLGMGEKDVAIPYDQVKFSEQSTMPNTAATNAATTTAPNNSGAAPMTPDPTMANHSKAYPDHGTIDMTADQIKNAPTFHFTM